MGLRENYFRVVDEIKTACIKAKRDPDHVKLIAVSKNIGTQLIEELQRVGQKSFGESYVQELITKYEVIKDVEWHYIGHLQRNKAKYLVGKVALIHSVDSIGLVEELNKVCLNRDLTVEILVQVNIAREEGKHGIFKEDLPSIFEAIAKCPRVICGGLMVIPPFFEEPEKARGYYKELNRLFKIYKEQGIAAPNIKLTDLSMGMTHDFKVAVEEGATLLRIGTAIFGPRA